MPTTSARVVSGDFSPAADIGTDQGLTMDVAGRLRVASAGTPYDPALNPNPNRNPATIAAGRQSVTGTAAPLAAQALANGVVVKAGSANAGVVYVGPAGVTTATGYPLAAGEAISFGVTNTSAIYVLVAVAAADTVAWTGN